MTCIYSQVLGEAPQSQSAFVRGFIDDLLKIVFPPGDYESQSAFVRGFIDDARRLYVRTGGSCLRLNPRSCAASSMTALTSRPPLEPIKSQSAFVRGFIDDRPAGAPRPSSGSRSQSAFVRGFIDDGESSGTGTFPGTSQSAFVRGFIDDGSTSRSAWSSRPSLNPRSCAASSMTLH